MREIACLAAAGCVYETAVAAARGDASSTAVAASAATLILVVTGIVVAFVLGWSRHETPVGQFDSRAPASL